MIDSIKLAENIKRQRIKNKLTQTELASKIFVSCQAVSKWERGLTIPELDKVCLLCNCFNISIDELIGHNFDKNIYMIAVDGGGSKTEFMLFDAEGNVYEKYILGGSNPNAIGIDAAAKIFIDGIEKLISIKQNIKGIYIGASGFKTGGNGEKIRKILAKEYPSVKIGCSTDIENVINASGVKENAIASICGTGTVVYTSIYGQLTQYTGWGYLLDKGGSGYHIGRDGITAALEAADSLAENTLINDLIENHINDSIKNHISVFYDKGQEYIASFASFVFKAYEKGDKKAKEILESNALRTAEVLNKVKSLNPDIKKLILSGSIFTKDDIYFSILKDKIDHDIETVRVKLPQVYGAAICCGKMCGLDTEKLYENFLNMENNNA